MHEDHDQPRRTALETGSGYLGSHALEQLLVERLKGYVKTRAVNMYGFLHLEWLGEEALKALRRGQRLAGAELEFWRDDPTKVAVLHCHSSYLLQGIVQALPLDALPVELLEWRMQLDLGM